MVLSPRWPAVSPSIEARVELGVVAGSGDVAIPAAASLASLSAAAMRLLCRCFFFFFFFAGVCSGSSFWPGASLSGSPTRGGADDGRFDGDLAEAPLPAAAALRAQG